MYKCILLLTGLWLMNFTAQPAQAHITVDTLRCEYLINPQGIDVKTPRLSWIINSSSRGEKQTACQILVATSLEILQKNKGDIWDSGQMKTDQSALVEYAGNELKTNQRCWWKVRIWDKQGKVSAWSAPANWSMGLLHPEDLTAGWIGDMVERIKDPDAAIMNIAGLKWVRYPESITKAGALTYLRKTVEIPADRNVKRAVFVLFADNVCKAQVNGKDIGQAVRWDRTARLDAAPSLNTGENSLELIISQSDSLPPCVIGRLVIQFRSGTDMIVPIDNSWQAAQSAKSDPAANTLIWQFAEELDGTPWRGAPPVGDVQRVPASYLRHEFTVSSPVRRAVVYVSALGAFELHINGKHVGDDVLAPGWTEFRKRVQYHTYDVTSLLTTGKNAVGAILGDGWYASVLAHLSRRKFYGGDPRFMAQLVIEHADGSTDTVITDKSWKITDGPILHADLLMGCEYDARKEMPGWDIAGYSDNSWREVIENKTPAIRIEAANAEPSRKLEELPARKLTEPAPGCWTFDLGQNMVGWVRLKVQGKAGTRITVRHGEMLNADGTLYTANLRSCPATDFYILDGKGEKSLEPYFTFHGFRYVEVTGLESKPALNAVTGVVVHTDMQRTGNFECSNELVKKLYHNIIWGQKGNYLEIPTDCPQRDERMGWTGDTQFFAPTAALNYNVAPFFTRWLNTMADSQYADGSFPHVVPDIMGSGGSTAWGDAAILCAYNIYHSYGDIRIITTMYPAMVRYMDWLVRKTKDGITTVGGFGDWLNLGGGADGTAIDTAYHAHLANLMSEMARAIGKEADALRYHVLFDEIRDAFNKKWLQADGSLANCSQTGYALAFTMDLLPTDMRSKSGVKFVDEIHKYKDHLATGFIGTPRLLPALRLAGRDDMAIKLLLTETYPSWLYPVTLGATTMWERWNGWTPEQGFGDISMNSYNHYAFGAVGEYLYNGIGGIRALMPGYKQIEIRPAIGNGLTHAKCSYLSMYGKIASDWEIKAGRLTMNISVPVNTTAKIYIPTSQSGEVKESGKPAGQSLGVISVGTENSAAVFEVGSGEYHFNSQL